MRLDTVFAEMLEQVHFGWPEYLGGGKNSNRDRRNWSDNGCAGSAYRTRSVDDFCARSVGKWALRN